MLDSLEKLHKKGWRTYVYDNKKGVIVLIKCGKSRDGVIKIDIENRHFLCYNKETTYFYEKFEIRELALEELILIYKLIKEFKDEKKNEQKHNRRDKET